MRERRGRDWEGILVKLTDTYRKVASKLKPKIQPPGNLYEPRRCTRRYMEVHLVCRELAAMFKKRRRICCWFDLGSRP